jgi:hypothetical protein
MLVDIQKYYDEMNEETQEDEIIANNPADFKFLKSLSLKEQL